MKTEGIVFVYAKDNQIRVLTMSDDHKLLKSDGWVHTHTLDVCRWLEHICNILEGSREKKVESLKLK